MKKGDDYTPLWWNNAEEMVLPEDKEYWRPGENLIIVSILREELIKNMNEDFKSFLLPRDLPHRAFKPAKEEQVVDFWKKAKRLIPATILWIRESNELIIADGQHRLKAAVFTKVDRINIIIEKSEYFDIVSLCPSVIIASPSRKTN